MARIFVIAEAGVNHNGSLENAKRLVSVARDAGADAVKFQTYCTESLVTRRAPKAGYQLKSTDASESQLEMLERLRLNEAEHVGLKEHCDSSGIEFMSAPFDIASLSLLDQKLNVVRLKIPSGEITNAPLLLAAARTRKPIILSTGMSTLDEVRAALGVLAFGMISDDGKPSTSAFEKALASEDGSGVLIKRVTLLQCTSEYPAPYPEINLRVMDTLRQVLGKDGVEMFVGLSDHSVGIAVPLAAAARGASVIEKHFTLDRDLPGPDHRASLNPKELRAMVEGVRQIEQALGTLEKRMAPSEAGTRAVARKSLVASRPIQKGAVFTEENLTAKRPGGGISPMQFWDYIGRPAERDFCADEEIEA